MGHKGLLRVLVFTLSVVAAVAASFGIFSSAGPGEYQYESIRGKIVNVYGKGLYSHMSADVAIQGIAQDVVSLFLAIPLLLYAWSLTARGSLRGRFLLAGTSGYFFVTYLFYITMGMYNSMFLAYAFLLAASFFTLSLCLFSFQDLRLSSYFRKEMLTKLVGGFLMFNACIISLLWMGVIVPPLLDGSLYPPDLEHYTTLIVQGLDLGLLLPLGFVSGWLLWRRTEGGFLFGTTYVIFLSLLMTALTAKIIAMALSGVNVVPAVFIIPLINLVSIVCALSLLRSVPAMEAGYSSEFFESIKK